MKKFYVNAIFGVVLVIVIIGLFLLFGAIINLEEHKYTTYTPIEMLLKFPNYRLEICGKEVTKYSLNIWPVWSNNDVEDGFILAIIEDDIKHEIYLDKKKNFVKIPETELYVKFTCGCNNKGLTFYKPIDKNTLNKINETKEKTMDMMGWFGVALVSLLVGKFVVPKVNWKTVLKPLKRVSEDVKKEWDEI